MQRHLFFFPLFFFFLLFLTASLDLLLNSPLLLAAVNASPACLEKLIHHRATIDHKNKSGRTALHEASFFNRPENVQMLLKLGAKFLTDFNGYTPLMDASSKGNLEVAKILLSHFKDISCNDVGKSGSSSLVLSIHHFELFKYFVEANSGDLNQKVENLSIQDYAEKIGAKDVVQYLKERVN